MRSISVSTALRDHSRARSGNFDVGSTAANSGARTGDSAWLWNDHSTGSGTSTGLTLSPGTLNLDVEAYVETSADWSATTRSDCGPGSFSTTPTNPQDNALKGRLQLGNPVRRWFEDR